MVLKSMKINSIFDIIGGYLLFYCPFALLSICLWFFSSSGVSSVSESLVSNGIERSFRVLICGIPLSLASSFSLSIAGS